MVLIKWFEYLFLLAVKHQLIRHIKIFFNIPAYKHEQFSLILKMGEGTHLYYSTIFNTIIYCDHVQIFDIEIDNLLLYQNEMS